MVKRAVSVLFSFVMMGVLFTITTVGAEDTTLNYLQDFEKGVITSEITADGVEIVTLEKDGNPKNAALRYTSGIIDIDVTDAWDPEKPILVQSYRLRAEKGSTNNSSSFMILRTALKANEKWDSMNLNDMTLQSTGAAYHPKMELTTDYWHKVTKVYDQKNGTVTIYVDDKALHTYGCTESLGYSSCFNDFRGLAVGDMVVWAEPLSGAYYLDDIQIYRTDFLSFGDAKVNEDGTISLSASAPVEKRKLDKCLTLKVDGKVIPDRTVTMNGRNILISIPGFWMDTIYTIEIETNYTDKQKNLPLLANDYTFMSEKYKSEVKAMKSHTLYIDDVSASIDVNGTVTAYGTVKNAGNSIASGWMLVAAYTDTNKMVGVRSYSVKQLASGSVFEIPAEENTIFGCLGATKMRFMLWDSATSLMTYHGSSDVMISIN